LLTVGDIFEVGSNVKIRVNEYTKKIKSEFHFEFETIYLITELKDNGYAKLNCLSNDVFIHIDNLDTFVDNTIDKLQEILDKQSSLQDKLNKNPKYMSFMDKVRYIQDNMMHVNIEFSELLRELPFKYWKRYSPEQLNGNEYKNNRKNIVMEYIDMMCFFLNIGLALDITSKELYDTYMEKNNINLQRQDDRY
jgi:dimeric dUTPase (all-alpha-NTP-PPase superfamily)